MRKKAIRRQEVEDMDKDKKEKRRMQNVEAAKKSYENKKRERSDLQDKNKELMETQMKLLHQKSKLQEQSQVLRKIAEGMIHSTHTCQGLEHPSSCQAPSPVSITTRPNINIFNGGNVTIAAHTNKLGEPITDNDEYTVLDLSTKTVHDNARVPKALDNGNCKTDFDHVHTDYDHCLDISTLELGATQEVSETPLKPRSRKSQVNPVKWQEEVFVPTVKSKKTKPNKSIPIRTPSSCASDALKRDPRRKAGNANRRVSY